LVPPHFGLLFAWKDPRAENLRTVSLVHFLCLGDHMPTSQKDFAFVTHFIRNLRGGSQPILAEASDGLQYVVKFANNLQGPNVLFNESAGSELFLACGMPVPEWRPLRVSDSFLDENPDCWIQTPEGRLRPTSGLCFGSRYLGGNGKRILEVLPGSSFRRVRNQTSFWLAWLIDVCAEHVDNRQAIFEQDSEGWLNAFFVDHGHLFGGPRGELQKNFHASRYLDSRIYGRVTSETLWDIQNVLWALDADRLLQAVEAIPDDWKQTSARNRLERCLQRLTKPFLVQNILETIIDSIELRTETDSEFHGCDRKPPARVLCPQVYGSGVGRRLAHNPACA
jgi:hypothetical protein